MSGVADGQVLVFSELLLVWCLATASHRLDQRWHSGWPRLREGKLHCVTSPQYRAILSGVLAALMAWSWWSVLLGLAMALGVALVFYLRAAYAESNLLAEVELGSLAAAAVVLALIVNWTELSVGFPYLTLPLTSTQLGLAHLTAVGFTLAVWQSGNVVLGFLKKRHILPTEEQGSAVTETAGLSSAEEQAETLLPEGSDAAELRHGRFIGYLERLLIVFLVAQNSHEALGFLIAAKGLIRGLDSQTRGRQEYFLIGSLLSIICAVTIGALLRFLYVSVLG